MEKKTSSANRLVLKRILGQEGNNKCADCKTATHPRWASWNIGILICIRCSGIHRSLGTHISKVRSIDLDTWNDVQLEKLVEFGNLKANAYWESKLPPNYIPDESKIVNFIKTKYELKRWISDDDDVPLASKAPKIPPKIREPPTKSVDLLDLDGAFSMKKTSQPTTSTSEPLIGQGSSRGSSGSMPGSFSSATTSTSRPVQRPMPSSTSSVAPKSGTNTAASSSTNSLLGQQESTASQNSRADVKKSILSLYSQQPTTSSTPSMTSSRATSMTSLVTPSPITTASSSRTSSPLQASSQRPQAQSSAPAEDEEDNFANIWN